MTPQHYARGGGRATRRDMAKLLRAAGRAALTSDPSCPRRGRRIALQHRVPPVSSGRVPHEGALGNAGPLAPKSPVAVPSATVDVALVGGSGTGEVGGREIGRA
jgi:hypothetical protein